MDLQVERQTLSPGRGDVGEGKGGGGHMGEDCCCSFEGQSLGSPAPHASAVPGKAGRAPILPLSIGPCSCLFCLCFVVSGSKSHSSSGLWPHLTVQGADLLLVGCGQEEAAHLPLQWLLHLHVNVITRRLLLVRRVHAARKSGPWCSPAPTQAKGPRADAGGGRGHRDGRVWEGRTQ